MLVFISDRRALKLARDALGQKFSDLLELERILAEDKQLKKDQLTWLECLVAIYFFEKPLQCICLADIVIPKAWNSLA